MTSPIVIHTGPADRAERWVAAIRGGGFEVRTLPVIESKPMDLGPAAAEEVAGAAPYALVVVTSPRGAAALPQFARWISGVEVAAIGTATAKACAESGVRAKWVGSSARRTFLEALAVRVDVSGRSILHPHGDLTQDPHLPELAGRGARVVAPVVYRTAAVEQRPDAVKAAVLGAAGVTFTSPSGVRSFSAAVDAAGVGPETRLLFAATLGPSTEAAAQKAGFRWRGICRRAEPEALADLLITALKKS